jgi:signal transduction histidine kinase
LLGDVILRVADSLSYRPTCEEQRTLLRELSESASRVIVSYVGRRDDDLRKEAGKHIAFVAHELRSPVSTATMALALLKSDGNLGATPVQVLERSVGRLTHLIDNVLIAGRFDAHVELNVERIRVSELLSEVRTDTVPHADARGVAVNCESEDSVLVDGDRPGLGCIFVIEVPASPRE